MRGPSSTSNRYHPPVPPGQRRRQAGRRPAPHPRVTATRYARGRNRHHQEPASRLGIHPNPPGRPSAISHRRLPSHRRAETSNRPRPAQAPAGLGLLKNRDINAAVRVTRTPRPPATAATIATLDSADRGVTAPPPAATPSAPAAPARSTGVKPRTAAPIRRSPTSRRALVDGDGVGGVADPNSSAPIACPGLAAAE